MLNTVREKSEVEYNIINISIIRIISITQVAMTKYTSTPDQASCNDPG